MGPVIPGWGQGNRRDCSRGTCPSFWSPGWGPPAEETAPRPVRRGLLCWTMVQPLLPQQISSAAHVSPRVLPGRLIAFTRPGSDPSRAGREPAAGSTLAALPRGLSLTFCWGPRLDVGQIRAEPLRAREAAHTCLKGWERRGGQHDLEKKPLSGARGSGLGGLRGGGWEPSEEGAMAADGPHLGPEFAGEERP